MAESESNTHFDIGNAIDEGNLPLVKALTGLSLELWDPTGSDLVYKAARSRVPGMLLTIWEYHKSQQGTDMQALVKNPALMYCARFIPENMEFLLTHGADINGLWHFLTPLMGMLDSIETIRDSKMGIGEAEACAIVSKILALHARCGADVHAKDPNKCGLAFYLLRPSVLDCLEGEEKTPPVSVANAEPIRVNSFLPEQILCLQWALEKGVNVPTEASDGHTPFSILFDIHRIWKEPSHLDQVFITLAKHGYNVPALMKKYAGNAGIEAIRSAFEQETERVRGKLAAPLAHRLWTEKGEPSELLLSACGHGILAEVFEDRFLKPDAEQSWALYRLMEEKLPPQCQDFLRNGFDKTFLRDVKRPERSPAIDAALRRNKPDEEKGLGR